MSCRFTVHPLSDLVLGQQRELVQILGVMEIIRCCAAGFKPFPVEGDFISDLHQLMDLAVLGLQHSVTVLFADRLADQRHIVLQCIDVFHFLISFVVSHESFLLLYF